MTCPRCGQPFEPRRGNQRYCDATCQHAAAATAYKARNPEKVRAWIKTAKERRKQAARG